MDDLEAVYLERSLRITDKREERKGYDSTEFNSWKIKFLAMQQIKCSLEFKLPAEIHNIFLCEERNCRSGPTSSSRTT